MTVLIVSALALKGKGSVFYVGENQHREMTGKIFHTSLHAEMNALYKSIKLLDKCNYISKKKVYNRPAMTIYIVRLMNGKPENIKNNTKNNTKNNPQFMLGGCQPCINCQKYLSIYNIKKIKYTDIIDGKNVLCELRIN